MLLHCEEDAFLDIPIGPELSSLIGQYLRILCGDKERPDLNVLFIQRGTETIRKDRLERSWNRGTSYTSTETKPISTGRSDKKFG